MTKMANLPTHGQGENSLKRGTINQAKANPNKAIFLADYLKANGFDSMDQMDYMELIHLNFAIASVDSTPEVKTSNKWVGGMIDAERSKGNNYGHD